MSTRHPKIGDMLIVESDDISGVQAKATEHVGIVSKINLNTWRHSEQVFVTWQTEPERTYTATHGYSGMNIHNNRRMFRVFRAGKEIK